MIEALALAAALAMPPAARTPAARCNPNYRGKCLNKRGDYDCFGAGGDGPNFVKGPIRVVGKDVYRLDRNHDRVACEPTER